MKMRLIVGLAAATLIVSGCKIVQDVKTGQTAPLQQGELNPSQEAHNLLDPLASLPYVGPIVPFAVPLVGWIFAWKRGRRIRLSLKPSTNPVTGFWGDQLGIEGVVQHLADVLSGAFEVGPENSGVRRGWKAILASAIASGMLSLPAFHAWVVSHQSATLGLFGLLSALVMALEKELNKVLPAAPATQPSVQA